MADNLKSLLCHFEHISRDKNLRFIVSVLFNFIGKTKPLKNPFSSFLSENYSLSSCDNIIAAKIQRTMV